MEYGIWLFDLAATTNFVMVAEVSGSLTPASVKKAAGILQYRHSLLQARVAIDNCRRAHFLPCENPIPFVTRPFPESRQAFSRLVEEEQSRRFDTATGPLCRLVLFTRGTDHCLALILHHSIADGVCGAYLLEALLTAADDIMQGRSPEPGMVENPGPAEGLFEKRYTGIRRMGRAVTDMTGMGLAKIFRGKYDFAPLDGYVPAHQRQQHFIFKDLNPEVTARLLKQAQQTNIGLHSWLCAAQLQAIAAENRKEPSSRILQLSLVDLRRRLRPRILPEVMGLFISSVESVHQVLPGSNLRELAAEIATALVREMDRGAPFVHWPAMMRLIYLTRFLNRLTPAGVAGILRQGEWGRPPASIVSNIGRLDFQKTRRHFAIHRFYFLMAVSGSGYFASSVNTFAGRLFMNFTYASPCIGPERAARMADNTCRSLQNMVGI